MLIVLKHIIQLQNSETGKTMKKVGQINAMVNYHLLTRPLTMRANNTETYDTIAK